MPNAKSRRTSNKVSFEKLGGKHKTGITEINDVLKALGDYDELITNITLGPIRGVGTKRLRLKINDIPAGFQVTVKGSESLQLLYIYLRDPEQDRETVRAALNTLNV